MAEAVERVSTGVKGLDKLMEGGFVKGSVVLVTGKTGTGKCISYDTPVLLANGEIRTAKEIFDNYDIPEERDEVYIPARNLKLISLNLSTLKLEPKNVSYLYRQKIDENLIEIETASGRKLKTTKNHKFLLIKDGELIFCKASELHEGDYVAVPRLIKIPELINDGNGNFLSIRADLAQFLAFQIAEGDESAKPQHWRLRFHNKDEKKIRAYCELSRKLFNYNPSVYYNDSEVANVNIFCKDVLQQLKQLGFKPCARSNSKEIPNIILTSGKDVLAKFLRTYFDCEASVDKKNPEIELSTASENIANQIAYMLLCFGIVARIKRKFKCATNGKRIKRKYYSIIISGKNELLKFKNYIGFGDKEKEERLLKHLSKRAHPNVDVIPNIGKLLKEIRKALELPATKMKEIGIKQAVYMYEWGKRNPTRLMLRKFLDVFKRRLEKFKKKIKPEIILKIELLEKLCDADIFWDKVKKIKEVPSEHPFVYDFTIDENHTFVSGFGGIITHNTAFAASFLYEGAMKGEPGVYVTTEEREEDIKGDIKSVFGWDLEGLEKKKLLTFLSIKPVIPVAPGRVLSVEEEIGSIIKLYIVDLTKKIENAVKAIKAQRVVIDSISIIEMFIKDEYMRRVALMQLITNLKDLGVTSLITGTIPEGSEALSLSGIIEFVVDGVIKLDFVPVAEEFKRTLTIRKMRRTDHSIYIHPFEITKEGLKIIEIPTV
jgi:KaiC/GvpD/RAD55 family RecA-like ATPase/intein/homing endonuclease